MMDITLSNVMQFRKAPVALEGTELDSLEQHMITFFMERMVSSYKTAVKTRGNRWFDKVQKRCYILVTRKEIAEKYGNINERTVTRRMKHLVETGLIEYNQLRDGGYVVFLPTFQYINRGDVNGFIFTLQDKLSYREGQNVLATMTYCPGNQSIYSYGIYSYKSNYYRTKYSDKNHLDSGSNLNSNNESSKDKNEQKNDESNSSQNKNKRQNENNHKQSNSKDDFDIVTQQKFEMQHWLPKASVEAIVTFVKEQYNSLEGQRDVMKKIETKIYEAKKKVITNEKVSKVLRWERNPYLAKEFSNQMYYWLMSAVVNSNKSWWGYFWKSIKEFFNSKVEEALSDKAPEPFKHSKNRKGSNGRKHIKEKLPDWAKPGYKSEEFFANQRPEIKHSIAKQWNNLSWEQRSNDKHYIKLDFNGLPIANTEGELCYVKSAKKAFKMIDTMKNVGLDQDNINGQKETAKESQKIQNTYKQNAKDVIKEDTNISDNINQSNISNDKNSNRNNDDKRIDSKRKTELKEKLNNIKKNTGKSRQEEINEALKNFSNSFTAYN